MLFCLLRRARNIPTPSLCRALEEREFWNLFDDYDGNTYRAVYTVKFEEAVYVLHAFQKKSKSGYATPKLVLDLIRRRLKAAEERHAELLRGVQR
jgi:phage-related protein